MIVFCHLLNDNSGSPIVLRDAIKATHSTTSDVCLYIGSQGRGILEEAGVPTHRFWYRRSKYRLLTLFAFLWSQIHLYRKLSHSLPPQDATIYVNTLLPFGAAIWGSLNSRRVIYHIHEVSLSPKILQKFLVLVARKTADLSIYVSNENLQRLPIAGVPAIVIPNSVPTRIAAASLAFRYHPRRSGKFELLMLASLRDYKGIPEYLELAQRLSDRPDISLRLVINAEALEVERYLPPSKLPKNLMVHSRSHQPDEFYQQADLLLNLSRVDQWIETFGLTLVEAMAFGVPVIAPPIGGPTEIVTDGQEGFLIDSRDLDHLEQKVRSLADDLDLMLRLSTAAKRRAQDFTFESFSSKLRKAVSSVVTPQA